MSESELAVAKEKFPQHNHMRNSRLDDSLFSPNLAPHYMKLAGQLSSSELVPKSFRGKPQDLFICWAMGYQMGLSPEQSMQCIAIINGRGCMWGDDMLALCMAHEDFVDIIEEPVISNTNQVIGYRCTLKRKGMSDHTEEFDLNKAKKAGLLGKAGVWTQYPERMMQLRARGFALRNRFPDALKGIKSREEVEDYVEAEYSLVDDKSLSRTELLKKDFLRKTGNTNAQEAEKEMDNLPGETPEQEVIEENTAGCLEENGEAQIISDSSIRRLIAQKSFTPDRLKSALDYYDVESIDQLSPECAEDFYNKLMKL